MLFQIHPDSTILRTSKDGKGEVDLQLNCLYSLHALSENPDSSTFASHGASKTRIKEMLKSPPCSCQCRLPAGVLHKACQSFWSLPKHAQDALLWTLQSNSQASRKTWKIEGQLVSRNMNPTQRFVDT